MDLITKKDLEEFGQKIMTELKEMLIANNVVGQNKLLKSSEVLEQFQLSSTKLFEMRRRGEIPFMKVGGVYMYNLNELINYFKTK